MFLRTETPENIRQYLLNRLGSERIIALHETILWLDWFAVIAIFFTFFILLVALAQLPFSILWLLCFFSQGFVVQMLGLFAHDACTHRRFAGRYTYLVDLACCIPGLRLPSAYYDFHMKHHRFVNSEKDPEVQIIKTLGQDSRFKRLLLFSFIGILIINFGSKRREFRNVITNERLRTKVKFESRLLLCFLISMLGLGLMFPAYIFYGYFLPALIAGPIASMSRIIIEHTDIDLDNQFQIATFYRTNWFTRLIYFYDSGDCHLIHHLYSGIPFYKIHAAIKLMSPLLMAHGVREHTSMWKIYFGFLIQKKPFRGPWK